MSRSERSLILRSIFLVIIVPSASTFVFISAWNFSFFAGCLGRHNLSNLYTFFCKDIVMVTTVVNRNNFNFASEPILYGQSHSCISSYHLIIIIVYSFRRRLSFHHRLSELLVIFVVGEFKVHLRNTIHASCHVDTTIQSLVVCITHSLDLSIILRLRKNKAYWFFSVSFLNFYSNFLTIRIIVLIFGNFSLLLLWEYQRVFFSFINLNHVRFSWVNALISLICFSISYRYMLINQLLNLLCVLPASVLEQVE